jgi:hypothetical protein
MRAESYPVSSYTQLKEAVTRELARISEGTDARTEDGKEYRNRYASGLMMAVYRATEAALEKAGGTITDEVVNAAEEEGLSNGCDSEELFTLTDWLETNVGKKMQPLSVNNYIPSWARGTPTRASRRAPKAPTPGRLKYFSV